MQRLSREASAAVVCVAVGMCVAVILSPFDRYFLPNFLWMWGPQVAVIVFAALFKPRPAALAGIALALAFYLGAFGAWAHTRPPHDALIWLLYFFSLPGAVLASILVIANQHHETGQSAIRIGFESVVTILLGIALNLGVVLATVF